MAHCICCSFVANLFVVLGNIECHFDDVVLADANTLVNCCGFSSVTSTCMFLPFLLLSIRFQLFKWSRRDSNEPCLQGGKFDTHSHFLKEHADCIKFLDVSFSLCPAYVFEVRFRSVLLVMMLPFFRTLRDLLSAVVVCCPYGMNIGLLPCDIVLFQLIGQHWLLGVLYCACACSFCSGRRTWWFSARTVGSGSIKVRPSLILARYTLHSTLRDVLFAAQRWLAIFVSTAEDFQ